MNETSHHTVTPFNMHTDMVVAGGARGALTMSAKNGTGVPFAATITPDMAQRLGAAAGLGGSPAANPHAPAPVSPFNMHTDAKTKIDANGTGSAITMSGPADGPDGVKVHLELTIDGPALTTVKGAHPGI